MAESLVQKTISKEAETMNAGQTNVRYTMKFNSATGQWEQEEILTPLVKTTYPGIRTPDGGVKDISKGLAGAPVVEPPSEIIQPADPVTPEEPEVVTPIMKQPDTQRDSFEEAQKAYGVTSGGIRYEPQQTAPTPALADDMKFNVMGGGFNSRSAAQNLLFSKEKGILNDLVNPQVKTEEQAKKDSQKQSALGGLLGPAKALVGVAGFLNPRSEKAQIETLLNNNIIQVRDNNGNLLNKENALKFLTEDDKGKLNIKKGNELIESGYKVEQLDTLAKDFQNSAAFVNLESQKANNFVTNNGTQLTTLNPVQGSSGTNLFGLLDKSIGNSYTNGEQVLVVDSGPGHGGGAYRSDGKFVGMNGQIYAFGTADQARKSVEGGLVPRAVLERMTDKDGKLKSIYLEGGAFAIDSDNVDDNGFYIGDVVEENRNITDNSGDVIGNTAQQGSNDNNNYETQKRDEEIREARKKEKEFQAQAGQSEEADKGIDRAGQQTSGGDSGGGSDNSSKDKKIICTEMYRQTQLEDWNRTIKLWYLFQQKHLSETHQKGYHFLFQPFVNGMKQSTVLTAIGKHLAEQRTKDIKHIMYGTKFSLLGRLYRIIIEPICYIVGLFVRG